MATVTLSEVYVPLTFRRLAQQAQVELNAFIASGVATLDPLITRQFAAGGNIGELPQFNGITAGEPNYSTDVFATKSTPANIGSSKQLLRGASRNKAWSVMDLARELSDADAMAAITGRVGFYWARDDETRLIQSLLGVLADNVAADSGDMLHSIASDVDDTVPDSRRISSDAIAVAAQTMGDASAKLGAIAMHSIQRTRLVRQDLIDNIRGQDGKILFQEYLGLRVIVDDSLPVTVGTYHNTYTTILFGAGAVGFGNGKVQTPSEVTRDAAAGNGGGETMITSRVNTVFHPHGGSFTSGSVAGQSATYAELAAAANWDRVVARKNMNIAFLQTND